MKINVGDKELTIKKWKGRNKKEFINLLKETDIDDNKLLETLVYSCIEEDVILSTEEFRYVLTRIRAYSLGESISFDFYCDECNEVLHKELDLKDIIKYSHRPLSEINVQGASIKFTDIKNKEMYTEKVSEDPNYDFLFRIKEINGNDSFTLQELEEIIDEMDIDVLENIMSIYEEHRFKVQDVNTIECTCGNKMKFKFDELPGFFPEAWLDD